MAAKHHELTHKQRGRLADFIAPFRVKPGSKVTLSRDFDPAFDGGLRHKQEGEALLAEGVELLAEYQARLAAQDSWGVLVVLQALDAAGKDGTIRHVMSGVNPQGVAVHSFKVPSAEELDHDYLWRYARHLPARGEIAIFNRSHYEEVLVVRVHSENLDRQKLPKATKQRGVWKRRYREINDWERYLSDNGFRIVKLFLNLSKGEQRRRFLRRIDLPDHNWKFSSADVAEREHWDDYQKAFSLALSHTSTEWAPWYVIPADRKWYARIAAASVLVNTLIEMDPRFPKVDKRRRQELLEVKETLEAQAPKGTPPDPFTRERTGDGRAKKAPGDDTDERASQKAAQDDTDALASQKAARDDPGEIAQHGAASSVDGSHTDGK
jgi:PPK2 family polyphosphate:nucleotide phosphotransferase